MSSTCPKAQAVKKGAKKKSEKSSKFQTNSGRYIGNRKKKSKKNSGLLAIIPERESSTYISV